VFSNPEHVEDEEVREESDVVEEEETIEDPLNESGEEAEE